MKGKDFVKREVQKAVPSVLQGQTQYNSAQETPFFLGQINADRSQITDTTSGKVYNLSFTGNPREFEYAVAISDSEAIVNAQQSKFINVDGGGLDYFFDFFLADPDNFGLPVKDSQGNYSYTVNKLSKNNVLKSASNYVPLDDLTIISSFTDVDGTVTDNNPVENLVYSQDGRHLLVYRIGSVSTASNGTSFTGTVVAPITSVCSPPPVIGIGSCLTDIALIPVSEVVTTITDTPNQYFSYKLFKDFDIKKIKEDYVFTFSSSITEVNIPLPADGDAVGFVTRSLFLGPQESTIANPFGTALVFSYNNKSIFWSKADFTLDDKGLPIIYVSGNSVVSTGQNQVIAKRIYTARERNPDGAFDSNGHFLPPPLADYHIAGDCFTTNSPQGLTGHCTNDDSGYTDYFLPEGLFMPDQTSVALYNSDDSYAIALCKVSKLRQTETKFYSPPFESGIPPDFLSGGIIIATRPGTNYTTQGFFLNGEYFITYHGDNTSANAGIGEKYQIIGLISYDHGILTSESQHYPLAAFPLPTEQICFCDDKLLYRGIYPSDIYIQPIINFAAENICYQSSSKIHVRGLDTSLTQLNFYTYSKSIDPSGNVVFTQKTKFNRYFVFSDFSQENVNNSTIRGS